MRTLIKRTASRLGITLILSLVLFTDVSADEPDYVIISHEAFGDTTSYEGVGSICNFLEENRNVHVIYYSISDGTSADSIKALISNHYFTAKLLPTYVLLVGATRRGPSEAIADSVSKNFIPAIYETDAFEHHTPYDLSYACVDTVGLQGFSLHTYPNLIIGRLPVVDYYEIDTYVAKLEEYVASCASPADWHSDLLFVAGDRYRDDGKMPFPGQIRTQVDNLIQDILPPEVDYGVIRYSDFATDFARKEALSDSVDQGKLIVLGMATGANARNFCEMWKMLLPPPDGFDAANDLSNSGMYPLIVGASCNIGQSDNLSGGKRSLAENLLFQDDRGAIALIGPSGASGQLANEYFANQFLATFFEHPDWSIGKIFTVTKIKVLKNSLLANLMDTHLMYTFYGDPSLLLCSESLTVSTPSLSTGFEMDEFVHIYEREALSIAPQVTEDTARVVSATDGYQMTGNRMYKVAGQDIWLLGQPARSFWKLRDVNVVIDSSSRFLTYYARIPEHPRDTARIGINGLLAGGGYLSDPVGSEKITDQYGDPMAAVEKTRPVWNDKDLFLAFDLLLHEGETIEQLLVEYNTYWDKDVGWFEAYFDNISICPDWGHEPIVGNINMPTNIVKGYSVTASISADDFSDIHKKGDTLTYEWLAEEGSFEGSGPQVSYHAPDQTMSNVLVTCSVSDLGGHIVERTKYVNITDPPPPGCPYVYVLAGGVYQTDNVCLTESENPWRSNEVVTDYLPLTFVPDVNSGLIRLKIVENETEVSYIDQIQLLVYPYNLNVGEQLAIKTNGELVYISNAIAPIHASSPLGPDLTKAIKENDGVYFEYYGPGELVLAFPDVDSILQIRGGRSKALGTGGGGIVDPPPGKDDPIEKVATASRSDQGTTGNYVSIETLNKDGSSDLVDMIYPRIRRTMPTLTDLTDLINTTKQPSVRISWERFYKADQVAFFKYRQVGNPQSIDCQSAVSQREGTVLTSVQKIGSAYFTLTPGDELSLAFEAPANSATDLQYVLKVTGYYERNTQKTQGVSQPKVVELSQNYPNPFNSGTLISLHIVKMTNLKVEVLNILGQRVKVLYNGTAQPGSVDLYWDGRNETGDVVGSGIYYYRVDADGYVETRKMVLLK